MDVHHFTGLSGSTVNDQCVPSAGTPSTMPAAEQADLQTALTAWRLIAEAARRLLDAGDLHAVHAPAEPMILSLSALP
jgi:hypothetical protein